MTTTVTTPPATRPAQVTGNPQAFDAAKADWQAWMQTAVPQLNTQSAEVDTSLNLCSGYADSAGESATTTTTAAQAALAGANFKGAWSSLTGALNTPATVQHNGQVWLLTANLANVTTATPGVSSSWAPYSAVHPIDRADLAGVVQPTLDLNFAEQSYRVYDAATGGLQSVALSSIITYTGSGRTYTDALGILRAQASNTPRIEFDPITGAGLGLSVWGARTNLALQSADASSATWTKTAYTVTANATTAPDGTLTADLVSGDGTTNGNHDFGQSIAAVIGTAYAISVYLKAGTLTSYRLAGKTIAWWTVLPSARFNLEAGTVMASTGDKPATIENVGNGWYRCTIYGTCTGGTGVGIAGGPIPAAATSNTYDGAANPGGCYVWGFQFEAGSAPSPYIPTAASAVTAPVDGVTITGANFSKWFNPNEGTFVVLSRRAGNVSGAYVLMASDATSQNLIGFPNGAGSPQQRRFDVLASGTAQAQLVLTSNSTMTDFVAGSYKANSFSGSINGGAILTDTSGLLPSGIDMLEIGSAIGSTNKVNGTIARILYFPRALPSSLQALSAT